MPGSPVSANRDDGRSEFPALAMLTYDYTVVALQTRSGTHVPSCVPQGGAERAEWGNYLP